MPKTRTPEYNFNVKLSPKTIATATITVAGTIFAMQVVAEIVTPYARKAVDSLKTEAAKWSNHEED